MPSGGARPGAGRKRVRDKNGTAIQQAEKKIRDRLPEIVDAQIALALGVKVDDGSDVYTKPPDRAASEYLINRILGKPTERQEVTGEIGGAIQFYLPDNGRSD